MTIEEFIDLVKRKGSILVEGADCAGKTTFINNINKSLCYSVIHSTPVCSYQKTKLLESGADLKNIFAYSMIVKQEICNQSNCNYIFDRGYLTELIYGKVYRDGTALQQNEIKFLADVPIIVLCLPESEQEQMHQFTIQHSSRKELYEADKKMQEVMHKFWDIKNNPFVEDYDIRKYSDVYVYDYTTKQVSLLYEKGQIRYAYKNKV